MTNREGSGTQPGGAESAETLRLLFRGAGALRRSLGSQGFPGLGERCAPSLQDNRITDSPTSARGSARGTAGRPGGPYVERAAETPLQCEQLARGGAAGARGVTLEARYLLLESLVLPDQFVDGRGQILYYGARTCARPTAPGRGLAIPCFRHLSDVSRLLLNS